MSGALPPTISGKTAQNNGTAPKRKSLPREEVRQAFPKEPSSDLGGGVPLLLQTPLGGGVGRLKLETPREEEQCFDENEHTAYPHHF